MAAVVSISLDLKAIAVDTIPAAASFSCKVCCRTRSSESSTNIKVTTEGTPKWDTKFSSDGKGA
eukprot:1099836-Pyramimonas_sp.AAC.1